MDRLQNRKKRDLYFSPRVTQDMSKILGYPLTLVEAPMGYGKTTTVREHVMLTSAHLLWQNIYDDSKVAFWSGFCRLFDALDSGRAHRLTEFGFPDDSASIHVALALIKQIAIPKQTVIVVDDFHLVDTPEIASFFTLLAVNQIKNLHIILISRFFQFIHTEELALKRILYHIKKERFELNPKEIIDYYGHCEISLTESEADELYQLTEGWISALYLLMLNFKENGSLLTSVNICKLVEQAVYEPFSDEIKTFLLSMSIYNSFTPEQARYIMPLASVEEILKEVTGRNAFVMYDPIQKSYHVHSIFKNVLSGKLNAMGETYRAELYKKAAEWYLQIGDYLLSMRYGYLGGDFDIVLESLELDRGQSINSEDKEWLIKYFDSCSMEDKANHPYAVLIYAHRMFMFNEITLFKKSCQVFMMIYQNIKNNDAAYKDSLLGEYELLMIFEEYNDIERMAACIKRASKLLKKPSLILDNQSSWTYGSPSVLCLYHRKLGALLNEVERMKEIMPYYYQMTGNHGKGAEEIMSAERFYYRGDFLNAEIAMHKAYQLAEEASDITLCIIFLDIKLSFMKGNFIEILNLFKKLRDNIFEKKWHVFLHTIDMCETYFFSCMHMNEKAALWIKSGEFKSTRLLFPSLAYLNIVYGKVLVENGEYIKLLGMAEYFLSSASVYHHLLVHIYTAAASAQISRADDAAAALEQALSMAIPDQLYMPFAENGDSIKPLLEELKSQGKYADNITEILALCEQYQKAAENMIWENSLHGTVALTERENDIARLAVQGFSNKEIGKQLYISENTVKTQLKSIFKKRGIHSRTLLK